MKNPDLMQQVRTALAEAALDDRYAFEKLAFELTRFRSLFEMVEKIRGQHGGVILGLDATRPCFRERTAEDETELARYLREEGAAK